jgi:pimeloyl-ACP methyl ester carboxylesterase
MPQQTPPAPSANGVLASAALEHHHVFTNGVRLHVVQAGPHEGELILFLHGFPEFWYGWHNQIAYFAERGYRVWAPDQRGYNLSEKPAGHDAYQLDVLARDIIGLIDASGRERVFLVGHDWGAAVAWWVAIHAPDRLKRLVILNVPHPGVMMHAVRTNPQQALKSWYIGLFQVPGLELALGAFGARPVRDLLRNSANPGTFSDEDLAQYAQAAQQPGALTAMLGWYRAIVQHPPEPPRDPRVHVKTLILWGKRDIALTHEMAEASAAMCDDARVVKFEDATHWVQHDESARVNALLYEFFRADGAAV